MLAAMLLTSCGKSGTPEGEAAKEPKTAVKVVPVQWKSLSLQKEVPAVSVYLNKSTLGAPVAGYITQQWVQAGDYVQKGEKLFRIETKEHRALQGDTLMQKQGLNSLGVLTVKAPQEGFISSLAQQQGDYVLEGAALCTFTNQQAIYFQARVPYSASASWSVGQSCDIVLEGHQSIKGLVEKRLPQVDATSQNVQFLVRLQSPSRFIPEGLQASIVQYDQQDTAQVVPKPVILSDEKLQHFWVMRLWQDSMAVKVPVMLGQTTADSAQIMKPIFPKGTQLLSDGNYGLPDTARIEIIH